MAGTIDTSNTITVKENECVLTVVSDKPMAFRNFAGRFVYSEYDGSEWSVWKEVGKREKA